MRLRLRLYPDRVELRLSDRGRPYDGSGARQAVAAVPADADALSLPEGGRGLVLAGRALDELRYRRTRGGENRWDLVKRLPERKG